MDLNGDGLIDIIIMEPKTNTLSIQYNNGTGFSDKELVPMPNWTNIPDISKIFVTEHDNNILDLGFVNDVPIIGDSVSKALNRVLVNPFGYQAETLINSLDWNTSISIGLSSNAGLDGNIRLWLANIIGAGGAGINASTSINGVSVKMMDLDGDGLVDHVLRIPGEGTYWKQNLTGKYGQLKQINLPQGGNLQIEYEGKYGTTDNPGFKYVMSKLAVNDGFESSEEEKHSIVTEFNYNNGYYDRQNKESYGFGTVETKNSVSVGKK